MVAEPTVALDFISEERAAYTVAQPPAAASPGDGASRKSRLRAAIRNGQMVPTEDVEEGEFFTTLPHAWVIMLSKAHHMRVTEVQFLLMLLMHSRGMGSPWAIVDPFDRNAPTMAQWCGWLDWKTEQFCHVRKALLERRVIDAVDGDVARLAFHERWEDWDGAIFAHHPNRRNPAPKHRQSPTDYLISGAKRVSKRHATDYLISPHGLNNQSALIKQSVGGGAEARPQAARRGALKNIRLEDIQIESNDSTADAVATAPLGGVATSSSDDGAETPPIPPIPARLPVAGEYRKSPAPLPDSGSEPLPRSAAPSPARRAPVRAAAVPHVEDTAKPKGQRLAPGEREYCVALLAAIETVLAGEKPPNHAQEWAGARWFFRQAPQAPAEVESVAACYLAEMRRPCWEGRYLSLMSLTKAYGPYQRNPTGFRASVQRSIAAKNGAYNRSAQSPRGRDESSGRGYVRPEPPPMVMLGDWRIEGESDEDYTRRTGKPAPKRAVPE